MAIRPSKKNKALTLEQVNVIVVKAYKKLYQRHKELQDEYVSLTLR